MCLYINANLVNSSSTGAAIKKTSKALIFGDYNGNYDEFAIYGTAFLNTRILADYNKYRQH
jgi:hypothetical protein